VIFVCVSVLAFRTMSPLALRRQRPSMALHTGTTALVGRRATVLERIANAMASAE